MIHDCSAYKLQEKHLAAILLGIEKTVRESEQLKQRGASKDTKDKKADELKSKTDKAVEIDPHLAYFQLVANKSGLENHIREAWKPTLPTTNHGALLRKLSLTPDASEIKELPSFSFVISVPFTLHRPYISKDEENFYLIDNPVRKEKIFGTPMIASSGWKGALRYAFHQMGYPDSHAVTKRLFGNPRESEDLQSGRLHFYSSFFDKEALEIINPHDRKTGITKHGPILIEAVPAYQKSRFSLLYVPMIACGDTPEKIRAEMATDMELVAQGLQAMLTVFGFGAKTSSGYGIAKDEMTGKEGKIAVHLPIPSDVNNNEVTPRREFPQAIWTFKTLTELPELAKRVGKAVTTSDGEIA